MAGDRAFAGGKSVKLTGLLATGHSKRIKRTLRYKHMMGYCLLAAFLLNVNLVNLTLI